MAYSNNYSYAGGQPWGGYGNSQRAPYNPGYDRYNGSGMRSYSGAQQPRKRSGCKIRKVENGVIVSGWRVSRGQMFSLYARPFKGTKVIESKTGKKWANLFVTITNKTTLHVTNTSGLFDMQRERLYIKDHNLVANPRANNGGYFGKHISRQYR